MVVLGGRLFSYERGTPVDTWEGVVMSRVWSREIRPPIPYLTQTLNPKLEYPRLNTPNPGCGVYWGATKVSLMLYTNIKVWGVGCRVSLLDDALVVCQLVGHAITERLDFPTAGCNGGVPR